MLAIELIPGYTVQVDDGCLGLGDFWNDGMREVVSFVHSILSRFDSPVMVDAGGGVGIVSLLAAVLLDLACWTFEPNCYDEVVKNIKLNGLEDRVHAYPVALLDRPGEMRMFRSAKAHRAGLATLGSSPSFRQPESFIVPVVRLDDMMVEQERIDFIKVDVEGAELPVLQGSQQVIKLHEPAILAEVQDKRTRQFGYKAWEIVEFLRDRGYSFNKVTEQDVYFWRREEHQI